MILITGASGFIGGALSDYLEKANFKIRRSARNKISQNYFTLNLENSSEIENSCKEVNVVIHLASLDYLQSEKNFSEAKKIIEKLISGYVFLRNSVFESFAIIVKYPKSERPPSLRCPSAAARCS